MNDLELLRQNLLTIASEVFDLSFSHEELAIFIGGVEESDLDTINGFIQIYFNQTWQYSYYDFGNGNFKSTSKKYASK